MIHKSCDKCGEEYRLSDQENEWQWWPTCLCGDYDAIAYEPEVFTKEQAIQRLKEIAAGAHGKYDMEHILADRLLLDLINDQDITDAFTAVVRWYS